MVARALFTAAAAEVAGLLLLVTAAVLLGVWLSGALVACVLGFFAAGLLLVLTANVRAVSRRGGPS